MRCERSRTGAYHFGQQRMAETLEKYFLTACWLRSNNKSVVQFWCVQSGLMCACISDTRASTCLVCARMFQEKGKPQEALKGLEYHCINRGLMMFHTLFRGTLDNK